MIYAAEAVLSYGWAGLEPWPAPRREPCAGCGASSWEWRGFKGAPVDEFGDYEQAGEVVCSYCLRPRP